MLRAAPSARPESGDGTESSAAATPEIREGARRLAHPQPASPFRPTLPVAFRAGALLEVVRVAASPHRTTTPRFHMVSELYQSSLVGPVAGATKPHVSLIITAAGVAAVRAL